MRLWPFLKLALPLGTLAGLALAYGIQQWTSAPEPQIRIQRPPPTTFTKLTPPAHGHPLAGKITSPAGEPLEHALVWLRSGDEGSFAFTDSKGSFRFEELGAGPWPAKVLALGFEPLELTLEESSAPQIVVLKKAYGPPPSLAPIEHAPCAGRLVLPEGPDALDATDFEVVLQPEAPTRIDSAVPRRVLCDAKGYFRIDDLIVAHYDLRVLPAWARGGTWPDLLAGVGGGKAHDFTHKRGDGELLLALELGTIEGRLQEPLAHAPVQGALVELALARDPGRVWLPQATDAAGRFALRALPAGRYRLTLRAGENVLVREIELGANAREALELELAPPASGH